MIVKGPREKEEKNDVGQDEKPENEHPSSNEPGFRPLFRNDHSHRELTDNRIFLSPETRCSPDLSTVALLRKHNAREPKDL